MWGFQAIIIGHMWLPPCSWIIYSGERQLPFWKVIQGALWRGQLGKELTLPANRHRGPEATHQPCDWILLEANPWISVKLSDGCSTSWQLDCDLMNHCVTVWFVFLLFISVFLHTEVFNFHKVQFVYVFFCYFHLWLYIKKKSLPDPVPWSF